MNPLVPETTATSVEENPYASPLAAGEMPQKIPAELWRFGNLVVAHRQAIWPRRCVKLGVPCDHSMNVTIATQYPSWLLSPLLGIPMVGPFLAMYQKSLLGTFAGLGIIAMLVAAFIAVLVLLILWARPTKIEFFISPEYLAQRRAKLWIADGLTLLGVLGVIASLLLLMPFGWVRFGIFVASIGVLVAGGRYRAHWLTHLQPKKTKPEYVILRGAGPLFLQSLPTWPYGPI